MENRSKKENTEKKPFKKGVQMAFDPYTLQGTPTDFSTYFQSEKRAFQSAFVLVWFALIFNLVVDMPILTKLGYPKWLAALVILVSEIGLRAVYSVGARELLEWLQGKQRQRAAALLLREPAAFSRFDPQFDLLRGGILRSGSGWLWRCLAVLMTFFVLAFVYVNRDNGNNLEAQAARAVKAQELRTAFAKDSAAIAQQINVERTRANANLQEKRAAISQKINRLVGDSAECAASAYATTRNRVGVIHEQLQNLRISMPIITPSQNELVLLGEITKKTNALNADIKGLETSVKARTNVSVLGLVLPFMIFGIQFWIEKFRLLTNDVRSDWQIFLASINDRPTPADKTHRPIHDKTDTDEPHDDPTPPTPKTTPHDPNPQDANAEGGENGEATSDIPHETPNSSPSRNRNKVEIPEGYEALKPRHIAERWEELVLQYGDDAPRNAAALKALHFRNAQSNPELVTKAVNEWQKHGVMVVFNESHTPYFFKKKTMQAVVSRA